jgi:anaerobic selenocysteine-containing dehydrogenase
LLTPLAAKADIWAQIRPGTDCALALAMLIVNEELYNKDFVNKWTYEFEKLRNISKDLRAQSQSYSKSPAWYSRNFLGMGQAVINTNMNDLTDNTVRDLITGMTPNRLLCDVQKV